MSHIIKLLIFAALILACSIAWKLLIPANENSQDRADEHHARADGYSHTENQGASNYLEQLAAAQTKTDKENPIVRYQPTAGIDGRNALDEIYIKGVRPTPQSVLAIQKLLHDGRLSRDEKIAIPRLLGALHDRNDSTGANAEIELDLKALASDRDKAIAGQAAIQYARIGYLPDTETVLRKAFDAGALDPDAYHQELAHLLTSAPPEKQAEYLATIRKSGARLASDVLSFALLSGQDFNAAPFLKSSPDMAALLRATQPEFPDGASEFGMLGAVRYAHWLRASATIESNRTGLHIDAVIVDALREPGIDPRKIIGFLVQPDAVPMLRAATPDSPVYGLVKKAQDYAAQFPASSMTELVEAIGQRMPSPPLAPPAIAFKPPAGPVAPPTPLTAAPGAIPSHRLR